MVSDWAEQCEHNTFKEACPECSPEPEVASLFEVPAPNEVKPQEVVDAFIKVTDGDIPAIFELFKTTVPPKDKIDRNLVEQQLRPIPPGEGREGRQVRHPAIGTRSRTRTAPWMRRSA